MTQLTTSGWPYPIGTDRVMDGDDVMAAVAALLEARVGGGFASGLTVIDPPPALDTPVHRKIAFPEGRFSAPPNIAVGLLSTDPGRLSVGVEADESRPVTADSFWVIGSRSSGPLGAIHVYWIAHLPGLTAGPLEGETA